MIEWNHHYNIIRKRKYCETIGGIPEILFLPEQYGKYYMFQVIINLKLKLGTSDYKCILYYALLQYV